MTIKERRDKTKTLLYLFQQEAEVPKQLLDMTIQLARNEVYMTDFKERDYNYRKTATLNSGDALPADFVLPSYEVFKSTTVYQYTDVKKLANVKTNPFGKATASTPYWYIVDGKFYALPATTAITFGYYWRPADLFKTDGSIADSQTDNMPQDTEASIIRNAAERCMELMVGREGALQLIQRGLAENAGAIDKLFRDHVEISMKDFRTR